MLSFEEVCRLVPSGQILSWGKNPTSYEQVCLYEAGMERKENTLYILNAGAYKEEFCKAGYGFIVCGAPKPETVQGAEGDVLWCRGYENKVTIRKAIEERMRSKIRFLVRTPEILWRAQQCTTIQQIGEMAYELLGNPVYIIGKNGHLLAFAPARKKEEIQDPALRSLACIGVDETYDTPYQKFMQIWKGSREVFYSGVGSDGSVPGLHATMVLREKFMGCMFAIETEKEFSVEDEDMIQLIADTICIWMSTYPSYSQFHENGAFSYIDWLLEGKSYGNSDTLKLWLSSLKWGKDDHYRVIRIDCKQIGINRTEFLLGRLFDCQMKPELGHILAICHITNGKVFREKMQMLEQQLYDYGDAVGVSSERIGIENIPLCCAEAQRAVKIGQKYKKENSVFWFDDLFGYDILEAVNDPVRRGSYSHPIVDELTIYDRKYNTCYTDTLRCFVQNNMQHGATAQMLGIHRNTLNYRLGKISELCEINFSSLHDLMRLQISFYLDEMKRC